MFTHKKFSQNKKWYNLFNLLTAISVTLLLLLPGKLTMAGTSTDKSISAVADDFQTVEVILQREYLDGEISEEAIEETIWSMEDFWAFYDDWQLVDQNENQIIFKKEFNDISPLMKMNGYFGLSEDGTLSIYNGKPDSNEVIQSFFQVNTTRLKSQLHESLILGIPVSSKDQYLEVLKTYEKYAKNEL